MKAYKLTKEIERIVDCKLMNIINNHGAVYSFYNCLDGILKELNIEIHEVPSKNELAVRSNQENYEGYLKTTSVWFYLRKLESYGYIRFIETAAQYSSIELGNSTGTQNGFISKEVSDFITSNITSNIVVSPEFMEYVNAGHISKELNEAKKNTKIAVISALIAFISLALSAVSTICKCL